MDKVGIISHDGLEDGDILRDVRDYTSGIGFKHDVTYNQTTPIVQPRDPAIAEILAKIRGLTQTEVLASENSPGAPVDDVGRQRPPTDDGGGGPLPAAGGGSGQQGGSARGMSSNPERAAPQNRVAPAVARSSSRTALTLLRTSTDYSNVVSTSYTSTTSTNIAH